ncbi:MAG: efflux RND transporter periplasmic adaptor subunit [Bacteroidota bacterium]
MKKRTNSFIGVAILGLALVACTPQSDLEKLKSKRAELKSEVAELDEQIRSLDTTQTKLLPLVRTKNARVGAFKHQINVQGEVSSDRTVMINAEANGMLDEMKVSEGQKVSKGQILAEIDTEILTSNIQELKTQLEFAEYNYDKQKELFDRGVGTEYELEQASNQVKSLQKQLKTLKTQRSKAIVRAPFSGVVDEIMTHEGEMTSMQTPLLRLVNNSQVEVGADISEHYYTRVQRGTNARAYFPTLNDTLALKITSVGNFIHPTNRTFRVKASIDDNERLLPNMLADLYVTDLTIDSTLVVPAKGLLKSQKNEDYIFALRKEGDHFKAHQIFVEVISRHNGEAAVRVLEGKVDDTDQIVVEGGRGITNGDIVRTL